MVPVQESADLRAKCGEASGDSPTVVATLRHTLRPGDLGDIVRMHGVLYAREHGFNETFEAYVAEPLGAFARVHKPRERLWLAERRDRIVGSVAIVAASETEAQLRWLLVDPGARGEGLGNRLLSEALHFCREQESASVFLWTVSALVGAARLYRGAGFEVVEQRPPATVWGVEVVEQKYVLQLRPGA